RSDMAGVAGEAPMQGRLVSVDERPGDTVGPGQQLLVIESMKMEHVIAAESSGEVVEISVAPGQTVNPGDVLIRLATTRSGGEKRPVESLSTARTHEERADLAVDNDSTGQIGRAHV